MKIPVNKKKLKNRSDYGVRVARPGYDANNCAQNQLLFNSGWPILQITSVIDESKMSPVHYYDYTVETYVYDTSTWELISQESRSSEVAEPPVGYTSTRTYSYDASLSPYDIEVNKKYVRKIVSGNRTVYNYPSEISTSGNTRTEIYKTCTYIPAERVTHRLGYAPFFMKSENLSGISGYVLLFSVDIAKDVDYPYTEGALSLVRPARDYGIKSSSIFGSRVPGLCSNMFSKLVQAVKTEQTVDPSVNGKVVTWSTITDDDEAQSGLMLPYEFFSYMGNSPDGSSIDGGVYYHKDYPLYLANPNSNYPYDAIAVRSTSSQSVVTNKNSLVVLRSPMVSPEYEERVL